MDRSTSRHLRLFLCGDVMAGRGIDQILPHPCDPLLHERFVLSARDYVHLAEAASGPIPRAVSADYIWGAALDVLEAMQPDLRLINLETSITRSEHYDRKGINYRMSPENAVCLKAAKIDCCALGNNHVLDWGRDGLADTLFSLRHLEIKTAGAGRNLDAARRPATFDMSPRARVLVFSLACVSSGVPASWGATENRPGVSRIPELSQTTALRVVEQISTMSQPGDIIIASIHWGPNWGYDIGTDERRFAHALIDRAGVSLVHGHSSHHAKAIEVYRGKLVLYGCGDFLNDYEGITGYETYRDDLALMYFVDVNATSGHLSALTIIPLKIRKFRLEHSSEQDVEWIRQTLNRESGKFGAAVEPNLEGFSLQWQSD